MADRMYWLVVPTYNEAENITDLAAAALSALPADRRLLIVDDASPDGTGVIADRLAAQNPDIRVLHRAHKQGLGPAYLAGFRAALEGGAGFVLEMDADFSHDPFDLPRLIEASRDADLVIGSRYVDGGGVRDWGPVRRVISRGGCLYARSILDVDVADLTGGFKCFRREVLEAIDLRSVESRGYAFQVELTYRAIRAGFRVVEIPILFSERRRGESKMSRSIVLEAAVRVPRMRLTGGRVTGSRPRRQ